MSDDSPGWTRKGKTKTGEGRHLYRVIVIGSILEIWLSVGRSQDQIASNWWETHKEQLLLQIQSHDGP